MVDSKVPEDFVVISCFVTVHDNGTADIAFQRANHTTVGVTMRIRALEILHDSIGRELASAQASKPCRTLS